ncbi:MAG TPA: DHH family phosphoesterase [Myxococcales bacterium]
MARPALQIGYHDHCFDGVASSATFLRFYREKVLPGLAMDQVAFRGLAHRAGQIFGEEAFAGQENAVVDFRYTKDPRLTWWFDHHQSAFESPADEAHFRADRSGRKFWDPTAKSCTRFLARVCQERFGWDFSSLQELVDWAEVIDGAQFPDAKTAVELTQPAMQLMLLIEATKDPELCPRLIRDLSQRPLSEVLREPWVLQPLAPLLARHRDLVRTVTQRLRVDGAVAEYDLADLGVDNVNKFIAYAADPSTVYTVAVTRGPNRSKVSLGSNPWKQDLRRHNLARIAERYGGGGHPAVAAISFKPEQLEEARSAARTIAAELRNG